ncbi:hypothetical protein AGMMS49983_13920 [Clostridia bacterium]|nr:hypothetical protein AGMMS49983_13920 [Clostridia bacterium]
MGAWGVKALDSDEGLDVVDFLMTHIPESHEFELSKLIVMLKEEGFFGETFEDIDSFYDNSAMALAELYLMFFDTNMLNYDYQEYGESLRSVKSFTADKDALCFLLRYLSDIRDNVPDSDGSRETVEMWQDSDSWDDWKTHLGHLIERIENLI